MKNIKLFFLAVCLMVGFNTEVFSQKKKTPTKTAPSKSVPAKKTPPVKATATKKEEKHDETEDVAKVKDMITFLEYVLNTLGSNATSARDKEVLVTQSYSKIFRDAKVQVEDDLDDERAISTNKDITAYLKDVDFFFTDVKFEFIIDDIKGGLNGDDKTFYKVSLKRNLKGTTTEGKVVNNTVPRFIEVNYDPVVQDLKIVSMYTHEINPKESLVNWWKELSLEWKNLLRKKGNPSDSVSYEEIRDITAITTLNLSNNSYIQNIEPLAKLVNLQSLNISNTAISDLSPVRNLTSLTDVNFSQTKINDLTPLKYSDKITKLNLSHTTVADITVLQLMPLLQWLNLSATEVTDLTGLSTSASLTFLDISSTKISDLTPIQTLLQLTDLNMAGSDVQTITPLSGFKTLQNLNLDSTQIASIASLNSAIGLKVLRMNSTGVSDLRPLLKLPLLEVVYCDNSQVKQESVESFGSINSKVLIISNSGVIKAWWNTLSPAWQKSIYKTANSTSVPTPEELAKISSTDSVNISHNPDIRDLDPLSKLMKLRVLIANNTSIIDLSPIKDHIAIAYLDISETQVSDISVTKQFSRLKLMRADKTPIDNIQALNNIVSLQKLYVDETALHDITAREFLEKNHACLLIYKTIHLNRWWKRLPEEWKVTLRTSMGGDTTSTRENLHKLVELETLTIKDAPVNDLSALDEFVKLKNLDFTGTAIGDLTPLAKMTTIHSLHATNSPIQKVDPIAALVELEDLDLSNTPIDDLRPIETLDKLTKLNCSGTQVKKLDQLDKLQLLDFLDCSNTKVGNLDPVTFLPLKTLKCYNTKISERSVEKFKKENPNCNVVYYR